jgi:SNF5 / SMARCB1 / INI1
VVHEEKRLVDQFEWDVNDASNSPESFARTMAADMGLPRVWEVSAQVARLQEASSLLVTIR